MRPLCASLILLLLTPVLALAEEPTLAQILRDGDATAKRRALAELWRQPVDEKHHPALREVLKDSDKNVRQLAASALAWSGATDKAVIDELIRGMAEPWKPSYRALPDDPLAARDALVKVGAKAVPALVAVLEDKKRPARAMAVTALGDIGKPAKAALPALEAAIHDRDVMAPHHVIEAKYRIDGDAAFAVKHLVPLLDTKEGRNCGGANRVIGRMGTDAKAALPALIAAMRKYKEREICYDLVALAPHFRDTVVAALREALAEPELAGSARHALEMLGEIKAPAQRR
jgi:HEAT repeat protein